MTIISIARSGHARRFGRLVAGTLVLLCVVASARAAEAPAPDCTKPGAKDIARCFGVDLAIPTAPGLVIVGLSADDAATPATPREFGMAVVNGIGQDGKPKAGFALDVAPAKLLAPMTTRDDYIKNLLTRLLWNAQASVGVGKTADDKDKSQSVGLGLNTLLWIDPAADPIRNEAHQQCMETALKASAEKAAAGQPPIAASAAAVVPPAAASAGPAASPAGTAGIAKCYEDLNKARKNASALSLSLAASRVSPDGAWGNMGSGPRGLWLTGNWAFDQLPAMPGRDNLSLVGTVRRLTGELVDDPLAEGAKVKQSSTLLALRLQYRSDKRAFHAEQSWTRASIEGRGRERVRRFVLGSEWAISKNVWFIVALGGESRRGGPDGDSYVQTGLKFGSSTASLFGVE